jgi:hypothetical protein
VRWARYLVLSCAAACSFELPTGGPGNGAVDGATGSDAAADSTGAEGGPVAIGCIPGDWRRTQIDTFDAALGGWHLDTNVNPPTLSWSVANSAFNGHSESSGTDCTKQTGALGDSAVLTHLHVTSRPNATGFRVGGPIIRAQSVDAANNLFYACLVDEAASMVYLARYDVETQVGSGQGFTHLGEAGLGTTPERLTVTLCAQGTIISCDVLERGLHLQANDFRYRTGETGARVMLADIALDDFAVFQP